MKRYTMYRNYVATVEFVVEAENEDEAMDKALEIDDKVYTEELELMPMNTEIIKEEEI